MTAGGYLQGFRRACDHWHLAFGPPVKGAQPPQIYQTSIIMAIVVNMSKIAFRWSGAYVFPSLVILWTNKDDVLWISSQPFVDMVVTLEQLSGST